MKPKEITVHYERKFNLGSDIRNYNSLAIGVSVSAEVEPDIDGIDDGDPIQVVMDELFAQARQTVRDQAVPVIAHDRSKAVQAFMALPEETQNDIMQSLYNGNGESE